MNNSAARSDSGNGVYHPDVKSISLVDLLDNLFYYRWHFLFIFFLVSTAAVIYAVIATPVYTADALIQVEEKKGSSLGALSSVASALGAQQSPILGEIEILRSRSVVGRAVENLKANIEVQVDNPIPVVGNWLSRILDRDSNGLVKPLWNGSSRAWGGEQLTFHELVVPPVLLGKPLYLVVEKGNAWKLLDGKDRILVISDAEVNDGNAVDESIRFKISSLRARPGTRFRIVVFSISSRVKQVLSALTVIEAKRQSSILKLAYDSPSPSYASAMLNAISDVYIRQNIDRRSEEAELSLQFLNEELPKLRVRLDAAEKALNDFRSRSRTIDISAEIKEILNKATIIEKAQMELELKNRELSERYDSSHPIMKALAAQLSGVKAESANLNKQIINLPAVEQNYIRLARDVQVNNQLYVSLLNNAQQLQIAKAGTIGNVSIIDRAVTPEVASRPRKILIASVGGVLGIVLGFILCQILALISKVVRDPKKLEQETDLPMLAILPLDNDQLDHLSDGKAVPFLLAKERPASPGIEALRSLRTSLIFKLSEKARSKVILITSAVPAQGKSFIAANLSFLFSATGKKVILVEADIRMATSKSYFDFDSVAGGLSTILKENVRFEDVLIKNVLPNLDFLPSGPTVRNPGDLLATGAMTKLINDLSLIYDYVIIDSPPLLPVHDARSLGQSADVVLFVARQDSVSLSEVNDAIDVFSKSGNSFDGIVFNGFVPSRIRYGYGYGYSYHRYGSYTGNRRRGAGYGSYGGYDKE